MSITHYCDPHGKAIGEHDCRAMSAPTNNQQCDWRSGRHGCGLRRDEHALGDHRYVMHVMSEPETAADRATSSNPDQVSRPETALDVDVLAQALADMNIWERTAKAETTDTLAAAIAAEYHRLISAERRTRCPTCPHVVHLKACPGLTESHEYGSFCPCHGDVRHRDRSRDPESSPVMSEPETAADRALVVPYYNGGQAVATADVLAIEADTRAKTLDDVAALVEGLRSNTGSWPGETFDTLTNLLADIDSLRAKS